MENVIGDLYQRTASPYLSQVGGKSENRFTLIQTFDRRADRTKGITEANGQSAPKAQLEYSEQRVSMQDHVKNYVTMRLDRENGRQKIITSYARFMGDGKNLRKLHPLRNVAHIVIVALQRSIQLKILKILLLEIASSTSAITQNWTLSYFMYLNNI